MNAFERVAELGVGVIVEGVEVGAYRAGEEDGILGVVWLAAANSEYRGRAYLWNDGQSRPEIMELDL